MAQPQFPVDKRESSWNPERMQITDHVHAVRIDYRVTPKPGLTVKRFVYVYWCLGSEAILIDAGVKGHQQTIFQYLVDRGYSLSDLRQIVLTHAHADHIGALKPIQKETQAQVWVHPLERTWVEDVELGLSLRPGRGLAQIVAGSTQVDHLLEDRAWLDWGRTVRAQVIYTPGHSPGSVCLLVEPDGLLITGDALAFAWGVPVYDNLIQTLETLERLRGLQGVGGVLCSWEAPQAGGRSLEGLLDQCQARLEQTHQVVRDCVARSGSLDATTLTPLVLADLEVPLAANSPAVEHAIKQHVDLLDEAVGIFK